MRHIGNRISLVTKKPQVCRVRLTQAYTDAYKAKQVRLLQMGRQTSLVTVITAL